MAQSSALWTRRQFSQAFAASAGTFFLPARVTAESPKAKGFAFIGSEGGIQAFEISGSCWRLLETVAAVAPAHLEPHPTLPMLYAVHDVALWNGLPRGAVSAYSITDGCRLSLCNTQPLSLSATHPRHAAVSPDGRYLMVAAERGGLYNLLPIAADGGLELPAAIRKELGRLDDSVAKAALPQQILFHPNGSTALTADSGQESIGILGIDGEAIHLRHRIRAHAGAGPSQIALSASGEWIYAQHAGDGSISSHRLTEAGVQPSALTYVPQQPGPARMAMHPGGRFLLTANGNSLTTLCICPRTGSLSPAASIRLQSSSCVLAFAPDGAHLYGLGHDGQILHSAFSPRSGALSAPRAVARVDGGISLLVRSA